APLTQQFFIVVETGNVLPDGDTEQLAVMAHSRDRTAEEIIEGLDGVALQPSIQRLKQIEGVRACPIIKEERDVDVGRVEAGFAEEPLTERARIESHELDL